jgi:hypothetical protein
MGSSFHSRRLRPRVDLTDPTDVTGQGGYMRKSLNLLGAAAVAAVLATSAFAANRGVTFTAIGFHPDASGPFIASNIYSMNPQGTVFMATPTYFGNYCFKWTREGGWGTEIGEATSACQMSANGTIMATGLYPGSDPAYAWPGTWAGAPNVWNPIAAPADYEPCGSPGINFYDMGAAALRDRLMWTTFPPRLPLGQGHQHHDPRIAQRQVGPR